MAATREESQVLWSGASEVTLSSTNVWSVSDALTFDASDWSGALIVWADNQGSPASGDLVDIGILYTGGDVDGSAGSDYVNQDNFDLLTQLDTYNNDDGNGVVLKVIPLDVMAALGFKVCARGATAGTRNVKVRARLVTQRGAI